MNFVMSPYTGRLQSATVTLDTDALRGNDLYLHREHVMVHLKQFWDKNLNDASTFAKHQHRKAEVFKD